jgi:hypothetical protein
VTTQEQDPVTLPPRDTTVHRLECLPPFRMLMTDSVCYIQDFPRTKLWNPQAGT